MAAKVPPPAPGYATADLPPDFLAESRRKFSHFVAEAKGRGTILVLCHSDADGLTTGAILTLALQRAGLAVETRATGKGGSAWSDDTAAILTERRPAALIVGDLGVRSEPVWTDGATFFVDHHRPSGLPSDAETRVVTGYGLDPTPTSALLAFACAGGLTGVEVEDLDWIAALGVLGDLGDKAPFGLIGGAKKKYGAGVLRDATTLINAPRRSASGDASAALKLLLTVKHPKEIAAGESAETASLRRDKAEVAAAYAEAKKAAPKFAGPAAAIRIHTPCQVHPLVAQIWRTRLPRMIVMGVNTGYRPGWVHFSARCGKGTNLLDFFREHRPAGADSRSYGQGHDQAGGGALPVPVWNVFARELGFGPEMLVEEETQPEVFQLI